jgi:hypothetical protein
VRDAAWRNELDLARDVLPHGLDIIGVCTGPAEAAQTSAQAFFQGQASTDMEQAFPAGLLVGQWVDATQSLSLNESSGSAASHQECTVGDVAGHLQEAFYVVRCQFDTVLDAAGDMSLQAEDVCRDLLDASGTYIRLNSGVVFPVDGGADGRALSFSEAVATTCDAQVASGCGSGGGGGGGGGGGDAPKKGGGGKGKKKGGKKTGGGGGGGGAARRALVSLDDDGDAGAGAGCGGVNRDPVTSTELGDVVAVTLIRPASQAASSRVITAHALGGGAAGADEQKNSGSGATPAGVPGCAVDVHVAVGGSVGGEASPAPRVAHVDVLVYASRAASAMDAWDAVVAATCRQLRRHVVLLETASDVDAGVAWVPFAMHATVKAQSVNGTDVSLPMPHPVTTSVPLPVDSVMALIEGDIDRAGQGESPGGAWESVRGDLQRRLLLPVGRPALRLRGATMLPKALAPPTPPSFTALDRLANVHEGLASPIPPEEMGADTKVSLVAGPYMYYHYLQDRFDDKGWGCAYRSLQTLHSWFRLNQYTDVPVPTHRQIQQTLIDRGEKEKSFLGTKDWIGSQEVGGCLQTLLGVDYKVLFCRDVAEFAGKGREIAAHFEEHGTPIMIGGGQLAFTILGIAYNQNTGFIRLLILDPHYCGEDDLKTIQEKVRRGVWCGVVWCGVVGAACRTSRRSGAI